MGFAWILLFSLEHTWTYLVILIERTEAGVVV